MGLKQFELKGKVAMVTGSTRGLGEVSAMALAKAGADIAVCGRSAKDLERVTAAIRELGQNGEGFDIDVTDKTKVASAVEEILGHFGRVDILVNNAGVSYRVPVLEFPEEEWETDGFRSAEWLLQSRHRRGRRRGPRDRWAAQASAES